MWGAALVTTIVNDGWEPSHNLDTGQSLSSLLTLLCYKYNLMQHLTTLPPSTRPVNESSRQFSQYSSLCWKKPGHLFGKIFTYGKLSEILNSWNLLFINVSYNFAKYRWHPITMHGCCQYFSATGPSCLVCSLSLHVLCSSVLSLMYFVHPLDNKYVITS